MIGWNYKGPIIWLEFDDGNGGTTAHMNQDRYIQNVLTPVRGKLRQRKMIFMQDGARSHTAKRSMDWMREQGITVLENWPANSPDLNPIEEVWAEINRLLSIRGVAHTKEELKRMVEEEWRKIPQSKINNYVMSFMTKTANCVKNRGGETK